MPAFSQTSTDRLGTCHPDLQRLFQEVIKYRDCTILRGHRTQADQEAAFAAGKTQLHWPEGKHCAEPSNAVDVAPYPVDWKDREGLYFFAGFVEGIAKGMGISIRYGGDWNSDGQVKDNHFDDLVHFELV